MELNDEGGKLTPRVRLGRRLRRLRERRGLSLRQLSDEIGDYSHSYLGRVELGEQLPSEALVKALDQFFDTDGVLGELLELAHDTLVPDYGRHVLAKEAEAVRTQVFTSSLVPGLLQTEGYARELFRRSLPGAREEQLEELVALRVGRAQLITGEEPASYWAVMDEAALRRPLAGAARMSEQLVHILEMATRPNITLQVLPFSRGAHPMLGGSLTLHTLPGGGTIASVESFASGVPVESPREVVELTQKFDVARCLALSDDDSLVLVRSYLEEYENDDAS